MNERKFTAVTDGPHRAASGSRNEAFVDSLVRTYFILVTLITAAMLILGLCFDPYARFGYEAFASPLIYGACGVLPNAVMYSKRELSVKEFLVRKAIQLVLIELLVLAAAFGGTDIPAERPNVVLVMGISIFFIFLIVHVIDWIWSCISARQITEELMSFQQKLQ